MTTREAPARPLGLVACLGLAALCYFVLLGGTAPGEVLAPLRLINALIGLAAIVYFLVHARGRIDRLDLAALIAVVLFAGAGLLSSFPRQSLDAVVAALAWSCALFFARDQLARPAVRRALMTILLALSAVVTLTTAARWIPVLITWWSATGILVPPLDLDYPGSPWGHWHDLALLIVMLYPAWWIDSPGGARRSLATAIGVLALGIVLVDGSRNVWLAVAMAGVVLAMLRGRHLFRRVALPAAGVATVALAAIVLTGAAGAILSRALDLATLDMRGAMWSASIQTWSERPLTGQGPGSFPWVLQLTDYFDTNSLAPRHPDSALFQLLAESGVLGVAAVVVLLVAMLPRLVRGRSPPALWAMLVFLVACVGANPSDLGFFLALAVAWAGLAVPHEPVRSVASVQHPWRLPRIAGVACLAIVVAVHGATTAASFAYDRARDLIAAGEFEAAVADLELAASLDPGLALYHRQLGTVHHLIGEHTAAVDHLRRATRINAADDLAWRTLALAQRAAGHEDAAMRALDTAIELQRSDPTNVLLRAHWHTADGEDQAAHDLLAKIVHAWPAITAAPGWGKLVPASYETTEIIDAAVERWERKAPSVIPPGGQGIWLALHGDRPELLEEALQGGVSTRLNTMTVATFSCDARASVLLNRATAEERRTFLYWLLRVRASALEGRQDPVAVEVIRIWGGGDLITQDSGSTLNPLHENDADGFSADRWGYRRLPMPWSTAGPELPSPWTGAAQWLIDPAAAVTESGLDERMPQCATAAPVTARHTPAGWS